MFSWLPEHYVLLDVLPIGYLSITVCSPLMCSILVTWALCSPLMSSIFVTWALSSPLMSSLLVTWALFSLWWAPSWLPEHYVLLWWAPSWLPEHYVLFDELPLSPPSSLTVGFLQHLSSTGITTDDRVFFYEYCDKQTNMCLISEKFPPYLKFLKYLPSNLRIIFIVEQAHAGYQKPQLYAFFGVHLPNWLVFCHEGNFVLM